MPNRASGLTSNGLGRINRSIEAFGYCILGAQANTRSSIIGATGTARNTQTDFLVLFDDAIRKLTVSNGPAKYQEAIEKTKVRLNFAIARGVLLLPSQMIINKESVVGYNNNVRRNQSCQSRNKKFLNKTHGWRAKQDQSTKQPTIKSNPQKGNRSLGHC